VVTFPLRRMADTPEPKARGAAVAAEMRPQSGQVEACEGRLGPAGRPERKGGHSRTAGPAEAGWRPRRRPGGARRRLADRRAGSRSGPAGSPRGPPSPEGGLGRGRSGVGEWGASGAAVPAADGAAAAPAEEGRLGRRDARGELEPTEDW
jgi:hypothetical protein